MQSYSILVGCATTEHQPAALITSWITLLGSKRLLGFKRLRQLLQPMESAGYSHAGGASAAAGAPRAPAAGLRHHLRDCAGRRAAPAPPRRPADALWQSTCVSRMLSDFCCSLSKCLPLLGAYARLHLPESSGIALCVLGRS